MLSEDRIHADILNQIGRTTKVMLTKLHYKSGMDRNVDSQEIQGNWWFKWQNISGNVLSTSEVD